MSISRSLVVGIDSEDKQRRYAGHYWRGTVSRGARPTAVIDKPKPKNRSVRTIDLVGTGGAAVAELRAQHVARAEACGIALPLNSFVFAADVDGSRPIRPGTWTRRFTRLRAEVGLDTVRLHDLRRFVARTRPDAALAASSSVRPCSRSSMGWNRFAHSRRAAFERWSATAEATSDRARSKQAANWSVTT